jgi:protein involved in polysaccharide export with SLBB domain
MIANANALQPQVLRAGDSLTIVYADLPQPTPSFQGQIKEDGTITLLQNKKFTAAGKTAGQLEDEIRAAYVPSIFRYMTVTVTPDVNTQWYYIDGEVGSHGNRLIYNHRTTVLQAIASAGGFTDFANKKKVKLTRMDGRVQVINCVKARENPVLDLEIYPGDKIYVPRRLW